MAKARNARKSRQNAGAKRATGKAKQATGKAKRRASPGASGGGQLGWNPSKFSVWSQRWGDPNNSNQTFPTTVMIRHPTAPFLGIASAGNLEHDLQKIAHRYLVAATHSRLVSPSLGLPRQWLHALDPDNPNHSNHPDPWFGWLPLRWPATDGKLNSLVSFAAARSNTPDDASDLIVIMQASQPTGSGYGIRVVAHIRKSGAQPKSQSGAKLEVSISGMSACIPVGPWLSQTSPRSATTTRESVALAITTSRLIGFLRQFRTAIASATNLEESTFAIQGARILPNVRAKQGTALELNATGQTKRAGASESGSNREPFYSFVLALGIDAKGIVSGSPLQVLSKIELVADAGTAQVFPIDPASQSGPEGLHKRRPTRDEAVLDNYRTPEPIPQNPQPLEYSPDGYEDDEVVVCPGFVVDDDGQLPDAPKEVNLTSGGPAVRSNDASAVMAYWNVKQFFDRLRAYGLSPKNYFRIAPLPVRVYYRSGIRPGPGKDGQTVNARVRVQGLPDNFEGTLPPGNTHIIEIHLALADLSTRARKPWDGRSRSPAEPLGIGADARWFWHEIGHVLLTTSIGDLQFRFAHSPGDALAAIVSDPESELANDPNWRGATFPWVFLPRRHDRCVTLGWSWGGTLHYDLSQVQDLAGPRQKAYWTEQILSSSLFRLYRCIGGDTNDVPSPYDRGPHARRSASHYCVYLIMRAIQILGTSLVVPANDPDLFVSALIDADINTASNSPWHVVFPPVFPRPLQGQTDTFDRVGGCVHKVIRWAFEAQGLYTPPGTITNAPGSPPPVDIYIADQRPTIDVDLGIDYGAGSYNPVSLEWDTTQTQSAVPPLWQADPGAISIANNGKISIVVGNRGTAIATNVTVSVWWHEWPAGSPPNWDSASWTSCPPSSSASLNINPRGQATFGPFAAVPLASSKRYILLARASCADDLANIDAATNLPCSQQPTSLVDLVANDNNLGLWVLLS